MKALLLSVHPLIWILFFTSSLAFVYFAPYDIYFSALFYSEEKGFYLRYEWWVQLFYHSVKFFIIGVLLFYIALIVDSYRKKKKSLHVYLKQLLFLVLVLAIGPGLIVNWVFKENFGRARPQNIIEFGSTKTFSPAYIPTNACETNCSFSCGHASGAFFAIALALLARQRRTLALSTAIGYGFLVGLGRIIQGGHFFSDVVVSFFIVFIVSKMLYYLMFEKIRDN